MSPYADWPIVFVSFFLFSLVSITSPLSLDESSRPVRISEAFACRGLFKSSPYCRGSLFFPPDLSDKPTAWVLRAPEPRQKTGWSLLYGSRKHLPHAVAPHDPNQPFRAPWPVISIRRFGFLASRVTLARSNVSFRGFFVSSTKNRLRLIATIVLMRGVNLGRG